ncbi:MAG: tRNA 2-thiouridine(34) synthase MnmA [Planctomycetes bacterium]|nr:tRNA 2-thiouridine(34) synthase MnmA [Planctomycetota bacterium]
MTSKHDKSVAVAMSGGVDSSVAAALLTREGWDIHGVTMILPRYGTSEGKPRRATEDAREVAEILDIPLEIYDCRSWFEETVLEHFVQEYASGRTPNPCVHCNRQVKFGFLMDKIKAIGCDHLATGHYARVSQDPETGRYHLRAGAGAEDQSYFLFGLSQKQLADAVFPLGEKDKTEVRALATEFDLPVHDKPQSQDLCFLPHGGYRELLRKRCPELAEPGPIIHVSGELLGKHHGIIDFTIGQRRGIGISWSEPLYVVRIEPNCNRIVVGEKHHIMKNNCRLTNLNWVSRICSETPFRASVRIRYRHPGTLATVAPQPNDSAEISFDEDQKAPTPGQAAVFYDGPTVLGGGIIE